ncbi:MAG TPA: hypothetical protein DER10_11180 [Elusimicrobia bacterium]|nr:hypothetical protein [Elusimicrobiota bacterium]
MRYKYFPSPPSHLLACGVLAISAACNPVNGQTAPGPRGSGKPVLQDKIATIAPGLAAEETAGLRVYKPEKCYTGYTLFTHNPRDVMRFSSIYLIDMRGEVKHQWMTEIPAIHARLMPDGNLFYNTTGGTLLGSTDYGLYELDPNSNVGWHLPGDISHDFQVIDNDTFLISEYDEGNPEIKIVTRGNKVLWTWKSVDHIGELEELTGAKITASRDWAHNNTAIFLGKNPLAKKDPRFKEGNIMFSFSSLDTIGIIDYPSGKIVWAWGKGMLWKQHAPEMLNNGHILLFDNGELFSRVIELDPLSGQIVWKYPPQPTESFHSGMLSNATRLPNGNTLICGGQTGRIFEVTAEGEIVWEFISPFGRWHNSPDIYRAYRYSEEYAQPLFRAAEKIK